VAGALALALVATPALAAEGETWAAGGRGAATALVNVLYIPAKLVYAVAGGLVGGLAFCLTAGDREVAQNIWEPSVGGSYILTTEQLFPASADASAPGSLEGGSPGMAESEPQWPE
jgi:hypothetical protein